MLDATFVAGLAVLLGLQHGLEPDHVAAIWDLALLDEGVGSAVRAGLGYGVSHLGVVAAAAGLGWLVAPHVPARLVMCAEMLVGGSLALLGLGLAVRTARRWDREEFGSEPPSAGSGRTGFGRSLAVGAVHGAAAETPTQLAFLSLSVGVVGMGSRLLLFGGFSIGMLLATGAVVGAHTALVRWTPWSSGAGFRWSAVISAALSLGIGVHLLLAPC